MILDVLASNQEPSGRHKDIHEYTASTVAQWLRHYTTNRQVAGSIPDAIIGIFQ